MRQIDNQNKGQKIFDINEEVAKDCITNTHILIQLFIELHNKYVHREYFNKHNDL